MRFSSSSTTELFPEGSEEALGVLLCQNTLHALLYAISHFSANSFHTISSPTPHQPLVTRPADTPALRAAFSRALRALASSVADVVGPSLLGLKPDKSTIREESGRALDELFEASLGQDCGIDKKLLNIYLGRGFEYVSTTSGPLVSCFPVTSAFAQCDRYYYFHCPNAGHHRSFSQPPQVGDRVASALV